MDADKIPAFVSQSAQLASLLEVSGYPKPGNVHRTRDFPDVRYEHFLAGSVALGESVRNAAREGIKVEEGEIDSLEIGIGGLVNRGVKSVKNSHVGGNTHLGMILLFIPLAASAGIALGEGGEAETGLLREKFGQIMRSTTVEDSLEVYEAIRSAIGIEERGNESNWLGEEDERRLSVMNDDTKDRLSQKGISLYKWMEVSASWDGIARALTSDLEVSTEVGLPALKDVYKETGDINTAIIHSYLRILSEYPDTFIARKVGLEKTSDIVEAVEIGMKKAEEISSRAASALEAGGLTTEEGREKVMKLDRDLQTEDGNLNPGTTADLTAVSIMIALLQGLKY